MVDTVAIAIAMPVPSLNPGSVPVVTRLNELHLDPFFRNFQAGKL